MDKHYKQYYGFAHLESEPDFTKCAEEIIYCGVIRQCLSDRGHGPDKAFCEEHAENRARGR